MSLLTYLGGTNYKGNIIFTGEGQSDNVPSSLYLLNPEAPFNTTVLVNNFFWQAVQFPE